MQVSRVKLLSNSKIGLYILASLIGYKVLKNMYTKHYKWLFFLYLPICMCLAPVMKHPLMKKNIVLAMNLSNDGTHIRIFTHNPFLKLQIPIKEIQTYTRDEMVPLMNDSEQFLAKESMVPFSHKNNMFVINNKGFISDRETFKAIFNNKEIDT